MISNKGDLRSWLNYERAKYHLPHSMAKSIIMYLYGNETAVIWNFQRRLRTTEYYKNTGKTLLFHISNCMLNHKRNKYGLHIALNVCGKGLKIMHLGPILTNKACKMGEDVSLHINTSFVASGLSGEAPKLGNGVVVGVGAVIVGNVEIANNVAIGANAVVTKDIPEEDIAVAGVPARKISDNGRSKWNKKNVSEQ